jgi:hypothetical protein
LLTRFSERYAGLDPDTWSMIDRMVCDTNKVVNVLNAAALANVNRAKQ